MIENMKGGRWVIIITFLMQVKIQKKCIVQSEKYGTLNNTLRVYSRLDYQPLFRKGARTTTLKFFSGRNAD